MHGRDAHATSGATRVSQYWPSRSYRPPNPIQPLRDFVRYSPRGRASLCVGRWAMFEHLENRSLYSVSYDQTTGALTITGTPGKDRVIFSEEILHETGKHVLRLHFNGTVQDFKKGSVRKIDIQTFE